MTEGLGDLSNGSEAGWDEQGNQQYEIPADADLNRYATVVLWCKPFTVRIAVAELNV